MTTVYSEAQPFTVPVSGLYRIAGKIHRSRLTGRTITVENHDRRWWQFWKPRTVNVPEWENVETWEGDEVRRLEQGEVLDIPGIKVRL